MKACTSKNISKTAGLECGTITPKFMIWILYFFFIFYITEQQERMVVDPFNQYQKLQLQLYELLMMGVNTRNM